MLLLYLFQFRRRRVNQPSSRSVNMVRELPWRPCASILGDLLAGRAPDSRGNKVVWTLESSRASRGRWSWFASRMLCYVHSMPAVSLTLSANKG